MEPRLKYRLHRGRLRAEPRSPVLEPGSLLVTERVADFYDVALRRHARGRLLDLGSGASPLKPLYGTLTTETWSVDWPSSVHELRAEVLADVGTGVPLRSGSADVVLASDVVEHLPDPRAFLRECRRLLRPEGSLIGNVPFMYGLHEEPHDFYRYTEHGLRHLLREAGFGVVEVRPLGGGIDVLVDIVAKLGGRVPLVGPALARALQASWRVLTPSPVRALLREVERRLPLGYGFVAVPVAPRAEDSGA